MAGSSEVKTALVTGASSGFGHGVVRPLLEKGFVVYAAARRVEKMQDLEQAGAHILEMDVTDSEAVKAGVDKIIKEHGHIDIVFNNAGLGVYGAVETVPAERASYQFEVNLFGVVHVLRAVLPHMREAGNGRIINVSSVIAHFSGPFIGWYAASKFALRALTDALRMELIDTDIKVAMIEPGAVKTGFGDVARSGLEELEHPEQYQSLLSGTRNFMENMAEKASDQESTIRAMLHAATASRPKLVYRTTLDSKLYGAMFRLMPAALKDRAMLLMARASNQGE